MDDKLAISIMGTDSITPRRLFAPTSTRPPSYLPSPGPTSFTVFYFVFLALVLNQGIKEVRQVFLSLAIPTTPEDILLLDYFDEIQFPKDL